MYQTGMEHCGLFFLYCHRQSPPVSQPSVIFPVWEMKKMCPSAHANKRILVFPGLGSTPTQYFILVETLGDL